MSDPADQDPDVMEYILEGIVRPPEEEVGRSPSEDRSRELLLGIFSRPRDGSLLQDLDGRIVGTFSCEGNVRQRVFSPGLHTDERITNMARTEFGPGKRVHVSTVRRYPMEMISYPVWSGYVNT